MPIAHTPPGSRTARSRATSTYAVDAGLLLALAALVAGLTALVHRWEAPLRPVVTIDLSARALPGYTLLSLARGAAAYVLSFVFTLVYGTAAAYSRRAERVLIPLLDVLQGIPVLGFLPGLVLGMVALFPHSNVGLELACIVMIFTGQAWNMTFSFYGSLRAIPNELREVGRVHRFGWWKRFRTIEVPSATIGLVWNSMMSMAGGWFFLTVTEAFTLGERDFRLPGVGAYMSAAIDQGDVRGMIAGVISMIVMIMAVDQLVWRPALAWAQKFKLEETSAGEVPGSWVLDLLRRSRLLPWIEARAGEVFAALESRRRRSVRQGPRAADPPWLAARRLATLTGRLLTLALCGVTAWGAFRIARLLGSVHGDEWLRLLGALGLTFLRTTTALALGVAWALPAGIWIGLSPRRTRILQPVVQIAASFPAPMIFPLVTLAILAIGVSFSWGCVILMLLGAQWYILFNVLAGATALPQDLREAVDVYGLGGWSRWRTLYLPAVFPHLVTGLITAAGGAWNASIVAEYVRYRGTVLVAPGLGSLITRASEAANLPLLTASVLTMSLALVGLNRAVWRRFYRIADERYTINR